MAAGWERSWARGPSPRRPPLRWAATSCARCRWKKSALNPQQPRKTFDDGALAELAQSIAEHGVLVPILVRERGEGYELIAGERRWRACARLQMETIPAIVRRGDERESLEVAIIENLQREDLNALEEAAGIAQLIQAHDYTQEQVAQRLGKARPSVTNALRLLTLAEPIKAMIADGRLSAGHAKALLAAPESMHWNWRAARSCRAFPCARLSALSSHCCSRPRSKLPRRPFNLRTTPILKRVCANGSLPAFHSNAGRAAEASRSSTAASKSCCALPICCWINSMFLAQRTITLLMGAVMVFVILMPLAIKAHQYVLAGCIAGLFVLYAGVNLWLLLRTRRPHRS